MDNPLPVNPVTSTPEPPINLSPMPEAQSNFAQPTPKPTPPAPPEPDLLSPEEPKSNNNTLLGIVVILLVLSLGATGHLLFQNLQLKSQIAQSQPTPITSPTPTSTPDETANWKTYTGKIYSFKYPEGYTLEEQAVGVNVTLADSTGVFLQIYALETLTYENFPECKDSLVEGCLFKFGSQSGYLTDIFVDGRKSKSFYYNYTPLGGIKNTHHKVEVIDAPKTGIDAVIGEVSQNKDDVETKDKIFNQILSTLKFLETSTASPTATPKACTQEAKRCPDGSSVGRTGSNCEFAPCPTP